MGFYGKLIDGHETVEKTRAKDVLWGETPSPNHYKPCPRCGATQEDGYVYIAYFGFCTGNDGWKIICANCGNCSGRFFPDQEEAIHDWNGDDAL